MDITTKKQKMSVYFWRSNAPFGEFSQWYNSPFEIDGVQFNCGEQYMMYSKAKLFGNDDIAECILIENKPKNQKALGRNYVTNFNEEKWIEERFNIVYRGNMAKFSQNPTLKQLLLSTNDKIIAEASPYDTIWGIGISPEHANKGHAWRGLNLLGQILMKVRGDLMQ